jgi:hypothetical protein
MRYGLCRWRGVGLKSKWLSVLTHAGSCAPFAYVRVDVTEAYQRLLLEQSAYEHLVVRPSAVCSYALSVREPLLRMRIRIFQSSNGREASLAAAASAVVRGGIVRGGPHGDLRVIACAAAPHLSLPSHAASEGSSRHAYRSLVPKGYFEYLPAEAVRAMRAAEGAVTNLHCDEEGGFLVQVGRAGSTGGSGLEPIRCGR